ncbi:hypothetical protein ACTK75_002730 [Escherichia coli]
MTITRVWSYILPVAAKSAHGIGVPEYYSTHTALSGFFMREARLRPNYGGLCEGFFGSAGFE